MAEKEWVERKALLASLDVEFFKTNPSGEEQLGFLKYRKLIREHPAADVVPRAAYEQMKWERDVAMQQLNDAMQQLNDAGIPFCGKMGGKAELDRVEWFHRYVDTLRNLEMTQKKLTEAVYLKKQVQRSVD